MDCVVSGHVPDTPVVSAKSGLLFEKSLILHEIEEHGVCPVTKEPLTTEDLVDIKTDKVKDIRTLLVSTLLLSRRPNRVQQQPIAFQAS